MRLHTDVLTAAELHAATPPCVIVRATRHGSRSRDHAFEVQLRGYGARHHRRPNTGQYGGYGARHHAATYSDWGHWLATLYRLDPELVAGPYKGVVDFHKQTCGLYREPGTTKALAGRVRALRECPGCCSLDELLPLVASEQRVAAPPSLLKRAIEGELS